MVRLPMSDDNGEESVLTRILKKRRAECMALEDRVVSEMVAGPWKEISEPPEHLRSCKDQFIFLLEENFRIAGDDDVTPASKRRKALNVLKSLLSELDSRKDENSAVDSASLPEISDIPAHNAAIVARPEPQRPSSITATRLVAESDATMTKKTAPEPQQAEQSRNDSEQIGENQMQVDEENEEGQVSPAERPSVDKSSEKSQAGSRAVTGVSSDLQKQTLGGEPLTAEVQKNNEGGQGATRSLQVRDTINESQQVSSQPLQGGTAATSGPAVASNLGNETHLQSGATAPSSLTTTQNQTTGGDSNSKNNAQPRTDAATQPEVRNMPPHVDMLARTSSAPALAQGSNDSATARSDGTSQSRSQPPAGNALSLSQHRALQAQLLSGQQNAQHDPVSRFVPQVSVGAPDQLATGSQQTPNPTQPPQGPAAFNQRGYGFSTVPNSGGNMSNQSSRFDSRTLPPGPGNGPAIPFQYPFTIQPHWGQALSGSQTSQFTVPPPPPPPQGQALSGQQRSGFQASQFTVPPPPPPQGQALSEQQRSGSQASQFTVPQPPPPQGQTLTEQQRSRSGPQTQFNAQPPQGQALSVQQRTGSNTSLINSQPPQRQAFSEQQRSGSQTSQYTSQPPQGQAISEQERSGSLASQGSAVAQANSAPMNGRFLPPPNIGGATTATIAGALIQRTSNVVTSAQSQQGQNSTIQPQGSRVYGANSSGAQNSAMNSTNARVDPPQQMDSGPGATVKPQVQGRAARALQGRSSLQQMLAETSSAKDGNVTIAVAKDDAREKNYLFSCALRERSLKLRVTFKHLSIKQDMALDLEGRLNSWDPYWKPIVHVAMGRTSVVFRSEPPQQEGVKTAARIQFEPTRVGDCEYNGSNVKCIAEIPGLCWNRGATAARTATDNEVALLLRMLPVARPTGGKRADCHLWPKGTFLEVGTSQGGLRPVFIGQRKQQRHDASEWKGMSEPIDISRYINNPQKPVTVQMICHDQQVYLYSLAVCQYRSPDALFQMLTGNGEHAMSRIDRDTGWRMAVAFAQKQMIVIDSDDEKGDDSGKIVFSLVCPISKQVIETPVRARACKHWQCFDLKNFLAYNAPISGNRWRCGACERFVSLNELEICGFTADLLKEFGGSVTTQRDRVEVSGDGCYKLLMERKARFNKRGSTNDEKVAAGKRAKSDQDLIVMD